MKSYWLFGLGVAVVVALLFLVQSGSADKQDWSRSYSRKDKIPFGTYIFFNLVSDVFPGQPLTPQAQNMFDYLRAWRYGNEADRQLRYRQEMEEWDRQLRRQQATDPNSAYDPEQTEAYPDQERLSSDYVEYPDGDGNPPPATAEPLESSPEHTELRPNREPAPNESLDALGHPRVNYLLFVESFKPDKYVTEDLLEYVRAGNTVFVATSEITGPLADSLKLRIAYDNFVNVNIDQEVDTSGVFGMFNKVFLDSISLRFVADSVRHFTYRAVTLQGSVARFDTTRAEVLMLNDQGEVTAVRYPMGAGYLYICSTPLVFTNYSLATTPNQELPARLLSHLPNRPVVWDDYLNRSVSISGSLLRFVFKNPGLKWAWYVLVSGVLLYVFFLGKRRQKPIPIIVPPKNTTVEFAETIGRLYYQSKDHKNIAEKRIQFLLEHIRTRYFIPTDKLDSAFYERVSGRTGIPLDKVKTLFTLVKHIRIKEQIAEEELAKLNSLIEEFHHRTKS